MTKQWVVISEGARPTADIYFLQSAAPILRARGMDVAQVETRRSRLPFLPRAGSALRRFQGAQLILCRALAPAWLKYLARERKRFGRLFYLIDDDIAAAAADPALPAAYRARMGRMASLEPEILAVVDEVVVTSTLLRERFSGRHAEVSVLTPPLLAPPSGFEHFSPEPQPSRPWLVGFYGTRAHLADLQSIAPALVKLHEEHSGVQFEVMLGRYTPDILRGLPRLATPDPLSWERFRRYQQERRVHIGLAPLRDTPFNRGKSFIKFLDITAMGGVGIYSRRPPYTEIVHDGVNGLLADDDPADWHRCLRQLLDTPERTRRMAEQAAETAQKVGDPARAAVFWERRGGA